MMKSFKSRFVAFALVLSLSSSVAFAPRANAMVAVASWNPILMGVGLATTTGAMVVGGGLAGFGSLMTGSHDNIFSWTAVVLFGLVGAGGMILLDGEGSQHLAFKPISDEQAASFGISKSEADSYNAEIDEVNAISSEVNHELNQLREPSVLDSRNAWESFRDSVSPETFSAMQKLAAPIAKAAN